MPRKLQTLQPWNAWMQVRDWAQPALLVHQKVLPQQEGVPPVLLQPQQRAPVRELAELLQQLAQVVLKLRLQLWLQGPLVWELVGLLQQKLAWPERLVLQVQPVQLQVRVQAPVLLARAQLQPRVQLQARVQLLVRAQVLCHPRRQT